MLVQRLIPKIGLIYLVGAVVILRVDVTKFLLLFREVERVEQMIDTAGELLPPLFAVKEPVVTGKSPV